MKILSSASLRGFARATSAAAAIEFGIIAVVLVAILGVVTDFGLAAHRQMQVQSAAQAGAQYAMLNGFKPDAIVGAIKQATSFPGIEASPEPVQFCGCPSHTGVATATCGTPCPDGSAAGTYVAASALGTYESILGSRFVRESFSFASTSTARIR